MALLASARPREIHATRTSRHHCRTIPRNPANVPVQRLPRRKALKRALLDDHESATQESALEAHLRTRARLRHDEMEFTAFNLAGLQSLEELRDLARGIAVSLDGDKTQRLCGTAAEDVFRSPTRRSEEEPTSRQARAWLAFAGELPSERTSTKSRRSSMHSSKKSEKRVVKGNGKAFTTGKASLEGRISATAESTSSRSPSPSTQSSQMRRTDMTSGTIILSDGSRSVASAAEDSVDDERGTRRLHRETSETPARKLTVPVDRGNARNYTPSSMREIGAHALARDEDISALVQAEREPMNEGRWPAAVQADGTTVRRHSAPSARTENGESRDAGIGRRRLSLDNECEFGEGKHQVVGLKSDLVIRNGHLGAVEFARAYVARLVERLRTRLNGGDVSLCGIGESSNVNNGELSTTRTLTAEMDRDAEAQAEADVRVPAEHPQLATSAQLDLDCSSLSTRTEPMWPRTVGGIPEENSGQDNESISESRQFRFIGGLGAPLYPYMLTTYPRADIATRMQRMPSVVYEESSDSQ